jgi:hypothetical protein
VSEAYDFTVPGFGYYSIKPRNIFFVVNSVTKRVTMVQAGNTDGTSVEWSSKLVARDVEGVPKVTYDVGFPKINRIPCTPLQIRSWTMF